MKECKDRIYLNIANELSKFSKCQFTSVGCIFVNENGRIVASGVNGTISGSVNCCDTKFNNRDEHAVFADEEEIHSEMNAIEDLARSGYAPTHLTIYTNISPCANCLKHLLGLINKNPIGNSLTIDKIVYSEQYHRLTKNDIIKMKNRAKINGVQLLSIQEVEESELPTQEK